jgi:hypothetical protein
MTSTGLEQDGLFRRSPSSLLLRQVQEAYDRGRLALGEFISRLTEFTKGTLYRWIPLAIPIWPPSY